jgi:AcrR family transcriptional regulator
MSPKKQTDNGQQTLREPRQSRSQQTLERIVEAANSLLDRRSFDELSIAGITAEARSSVGAFYARFQDKEALLAYLDAQDSAEVARALGRYAEDPRWAGGSLRAIISDFVEFLVRRHRARRGLLRALHIRGRQASTRGRSRRLRPVDDRYSGFIRLLRSRRSEITNPSPDQAIFLGFAMMVGTVRERILFGDSLSSAEPIPDRLLAEELTEMYAGYLGI